MSETATDNKLAEMFRALGDQTRFKLTKQLIDNRGICVSELANAVDISVAGVSQQLKVLEQAGIISRVREGQKICYEVNADDDDVSRLLKLI